MPVISDKAFEWAQNCFEASVEELLDDPSNLIHPYRDLEPAEEIAEWRQRGKDLSMDFDALVEKYGSDIEKQRLRDMETGVIPALPREEISIAQVKAALEDDDEVVKGDAQSCPEHHSFRLLPTGQRVCGRADCGWIDTSIGSELTNWMPPDA